MQDECENLARGGLRTLVITQKFLTFKEFDAWKKLFTEANNSLTNREQNINKIIDQLEVDMEFLAVTGVEDKLQEDICNALENLKMAGIKIWMLTGDKVKLFIILFFK